MKKDSRCSMSRALMHTVLIATLVVGAPGLVMAGSAESTASTASIKVTTDPEGAMVYVDGVARGMTPLEIEEIEAGDHRVTMLKDGYIENSRLVSLSAGETKAVEVGLTESEGAVYTMQVSSDEGGGKKWPLILGIAGGGAAAAYFLLRDTNDPPVAGSISASPSSPGLVSVTSFTFASQGASDPDGDSLSYSWDFGDGQTGSGQTTSHTYQSTGDFTVTLTVGDGEETASTSSSVTVRSLSGNWGGTILGTVPISMDLSQSGTSLSGTFRALGDTGSVSGSVTAPASVRMSVAIPGFIPFTMTGTVSSDLNTISGNLQGSGFAGEPFVISR